MEYDAVKVGKQVGTLQMEYDAVKVGKQVGTLQMEYDFVKVGKQVGTLQMQRLEIYLADEWVSNFHGSSSSLPDESGVLLKCLYTYIVVCSL